MRALSGPEILTIWETGWDQHPLDRALTVLAVALREAPARLAALTVGERDALLLAVREATFGPELAGCAECTRCGTPLEFALAAAAVRVPSPSDAGVRAHELRTDGVTLRFRLPDSRDLGASSECADLDHGRRTLVERCVLEVTRDDGAAPVTRLSSAAVARLAARMGELDPQAEVLMDVRCTACGEAGQVLLDIAAFFWIELAVQAKRLLREVHVLARAYAWPESDILAMSAWRRRCYLDMVGA
jgi:hypothetical protein